MRRTLLAAGIILLTAVNVMAQDAIDNVQREGIEWLILRWEQSMDTKLPRVLLVGDSIANGYHGEVSKLLKGRANVDLLATSKSICDPAFLREVEMATADYRHTVIHFNNGLHGWHLTDAQYEAGLRRLIAKLRELEPAAKLVWASSTTAVKLAEGVLDPNTNPKVIARNALAARIVQEAGIPINDLYGVVVDHNDWHSDALHFKPEGRAAQGAAVVAAVTPLLPQ